MGGKKVVCFPIESRITAYVQTASSKKKLELSAAFSGHIQQTSTWNSSPCVKKYYSVSLLKQIACWIWEHIKGLVEKLKEINKIPFVWGFFPHNIPSNARSPVSPVFLLLKNVVLECSFLSSNSSFIVFKSLSSVSSFPSCHLSITWN